MNLDKFFFSSNFQSQACIWDYFNKEKQSLLNASNQTLEQLNLQMDQEVSSAV